MFGRQGGRGEEPRPFLFAGGAAMGQRSAVVTAMGRLLDTGGSTARTVTTVVTGARLHHLEEGTGRPVVLLHGGSGGGANWFRLLPRLAQRYRVLAPDLPGFGLSDARAPDPPLGRTAAIVLEGWLAAQDVEDAVVVGTSFGGLAALRLAQLAPARVGRLLLLDSAGLGREIHPLVRLASLPGVTALALRPTRRGTAATFRRLLTTNRSRLSAAQIDALVTYLCVSARQAGTPYLVRTMRQFADVRGQREVVGGAELGALPQPVSLVWGALDTFLPVSHAHAAAAHCRDARVVIIPDAGHSPNWETPEEVVAAVVELAER
jgi:pimeloyl-ACP methyl ester carboxylesterase